MDSHQSRWTDSTAGRRVRGTLRQTGTYEVTLTVTDDAGDTDEVTESIVVEDTDGDVDRVEYELRDPDIGDVLDTAEDRSVSGTSDTSTVELPTRSGPNDRGEYLIVVTVYDERGVDGRDERAVSGSGRR